VLVPDTTLEPIAVLLVLAQCILFEDGVVEAVRDVPDVGSG